MSTASLYCRYHVQRLQEQGNNAPGFSESFGLDPRTLRPERLRWLKCLVQTRQNKSEAEAKIAAFSVSKNDGYVVRLLSFLVRLSGESRNPDFRQFRLLKAWAPTFVGVTIIKKTEQNQLTKSSCSAKALSLRASTLHPISTYGLEAGAETSPPFFLQQQSAPP